MLMHHSPSLRPPFRIASHKPQDKCRSMHSALRTSLRQSRFCWSQTHIRQRLFTKAALGQTKTSGDDGGSGGGGGGRNLGGSGDGSGEENDKSKSKRFTLWKGWEERVQCDPAFPSKVLIEQIIGVGAAVVGDMSSRPNWGLYELDFVFSTLIVGSIVNFALMYCLAATPASSAAAKGSLLQKLFSEQTLKNMGAPGGHMFEGGYSLAARLTNLAYKGFLFGLVGVASGLIGTAMSNGLILVRKRMDPEFEPQNKAPNVAMNALAWGAHMGLSANTRYQILYGLDTVVMPALGHKWFLVYSAVIRTLNNAFGGTSFVFFARLFGVQKVNPEGLDTGGK